ncbi:MAG: helix-turn-helix domain-containing protein [Alphaproteobacteria bacterium]|nr:helix-turn-helix domain-containing protein [Alphaproteobacteria bacterium]
MQISTTTENSTERTKPTLDLVSIMAAPIRQACAISGLSRSGMYRAAAAGRIRLLKHGRSSLVDMVSVREYLASLPQAEIRQQPLKPANINPRN